MAEDRYLGGVVLTSGIKQFVKIRNFSESEIKEFQLHNDVFMSFVDDIDYFEMIDESFLEIETLLNSRRFSHNPTSHCACSRRR